MITRGNAFGTRSIQKALSWHAQMLGIDSNALPTLCEEPTHWKRP